jgi:hypothetical protein
MEALCSTLSWLTARTHQSPGAPWGYTAPRRNAAPLFASRLSASHRIASTQIALAYARASPIPGSTLGIHRSASQRRASQRRASQLSATQRFELLWPTPEPHQSPGAPWGYAAPRRLAAHRSASPRVAALRNAPQRFELLCLTPEPHRSPGAPWGYAASPRPASLLYASHRNDSNCSVSRQSFTDPRQGIRRPATPRDAPPRRASPRYAALRASTQRF